LLAWKERRKGKRKKEVNKDTADKSSIEKPMIKGGHILTALRVLN
jgi:hypothetical protein